MSRRRPYLLVVLFLVASQEAGAAQVGPDEQFFSLEAHAFVSQGFILTTDNNFLADSSSGSFEFTEMGINFTKPLTDRLRVGLQLFSRKLGSTGNFSIKADWFYVDYHWRDWLGLRAGRVKLPFGLYNDTSDIDSARVPILLPQSVYPTANRDFLLAQTGVELYGYLGMGGGGALDYRLYAGTIFLDVGQQPGSPFEVTRLETPYLVGGRALWETPVPGLRVGGSLQALRLDADLLLAAMAGKVTVKVPAVLSVGSVEYSGHDILAAAEYSRWYVSQESSNPMLYPAAPTTVSERAYAMISYHWKSWLQPGLYYSVLYPNVDKRSGAGNMQHDIAATVRFDINAYWLVKLESHYMHGTAALSPTLNGGKPVGMLEGDWAAFLVKTTAYF